MSFTLKLFTPTGPVTASRTDCLAIGGSAHSFKTGMLCDLFYQICVNNAPYDDGHPTSVRRKALLISFDEHAPSLLSRLHHRYCLNQEQTLTGHVSDSKKYERVTNELGRQGWSPMMAASTISDVSSMVDGVISTVDDECSDGSVVQVLAVDGIHATPSTRDEATKALRRLSYYARENDIFLMFTHPFTGTDHDARSGAGGAYDMAEHYRQNRPWAIDPRMMRAIANAELYVASTFDPETEQRYVGACIHQPHDPNDYGITVLPLDKDRVSCKYD